ncbi:DinB family protein [Chitinophaga sp. XS-30]|nr:DinB family protein [Chitinophaga sp. XS-30]
MLLPIRDIAPYLSPIFHNFTLHSIIQMSQLTLPFSLDKRLRVQHLALEEIIGAVPEEQLHLDLRPGKWTAFENAAHLAAFHHVYKKRIERMMKEDAPVFEPYIWEEDKRFAEFKDMRKDILLEQYVQDRQDLIALVDTLSGTDLQRTGIHGVYGQFSIAHWLEMFVLHEARHLYIIFQLAHTKHKQPLL